MSLQQFAYYIRNFRTKRDYMVFQCFQLVLAVAIIVCAMTNPTHFKTPYVLWMELALLLTMAFDLFIIRFISEGGFKPMTKGLMGKIDLVIFVIFAFTLLFLALNTDQQEDQILETDDIIIILIVVSRYAVQIYRMVTSIKETHENRQMNRQIKQIDLNNNENVSTIYQKEMEHQNQLKNKITKKFQQPHHQLVEQSDNQ